MGRISPKGTLAKTLLDLRKHVETESDPRGHNRLAVKRFEGSSPFASTKSLVTGLK
jgi:hypothetical protein